MRKKIPYKPVKIRCCKYSFRIPHSGFWIPDSAFRIPDSAFRIPHSVFRIPYSGFCNSGYAFYPYPLDFFTIRPPT